MSRILSADSLVEDFISPGQACIKPVEISKTSNAPSEIKVNGAEYYEVGKDGSQKKLETASISLNDCLACSGCITSAESVLITMQSHNEVLNVINADKDKNESERKTFVLSLSPQSRASLAAAYGITPHQVQSRLKHFLSTKLGFTSVHSTDFAREVALVEAAREFETRFTNNARRKRKLDTHHDTTSTSTLATAAADPNSNAALPLITSACPGWICYAEKTHASILPHISHLRSPQQITGAYLKDTLSHRLSLPRSRIYHVSVMPCFDKKLEASRVDFEVEGVRDVDCVITTMEVVEMLRVYGVDLGGYAEEAGLQEEEEWWGSHPGSSAGGYLTHILTSAAKNLLDLTTEQQQSLVKVKTIRSSDMKEYILEKDGEILLKMATCYGFRNIQNIVRKLKPGKSSAKARVVRRKGAAAGAGEDRGYDYVEVMACPSGCINGGGQLKPLLPSASEVVSYTPKEWIDVVERTYRSVEAHEASEERAGRILQRWYAGGGGGDEEEEEAWRRRVLYTEYRAVEQNLSNPAFATW
ncbi:Cytosolic Fe-S cluster assembly factor nar1 [Saitoella coloradoensis]